MIIYLLIFTFLKGIKVSCHENKILRVKEQI